MRHRWGLYAVKPLRTPTNHRSVSDCLLSAPVKDINLLVTIHGLVADVRASVVFENFLTRPSHCLFIFPLVYNAVVDSCVAWIGDTVITQSCELSSHEEGEYGLILEQSSTDMVKMQLGVVSPGYNIRVELKYAQQLTINDQNLVKFVFPTYVPRAFQHSSRTETGGFGDIQFHCQTLIAGTYRVKKISSREILEVKYLDSHRQNVMVNYNGSYKKEKDFIFSIQYSDLSGPHIHIHKPLNSSVVPGSSVLLENHVAHVTMHYYSTQTNRSTHHELILCIDRSGSMRGKSLESCRESITFFLRNLKPGTYFNIIGFGSGIHPLFKRSQRATDHSFAKALHYRNKLRSNMRGTNLLGLLQYLSSQNSTNQHRKQVLLVTDGAVDNTKVCLDLISRLSPDYRFFTFGLGCTYSRHLVSSIARTGHGRAYHIGKASKLLPHKIVEAMRLACSPCIDQLSISVDLPDGMTTKQLVSVTPDVLFPEETLSLYYTINGKPHDGNTAAQLTVRGIQNGLRVNKILDFDVGDVFFTEPAPLHRIVLRRTIDSLEKELCEARCAEDVMEAQEQLIRLSMLTNIPTSQTCMMDYQTSGHYMNPVHAFPVTFKRPEDNPFGRSASGNMIIRFKRGIDIYNIDQYQKSPYQTISQSLRPETRQSETSSTSDVLQLRTPQHRKQLSSDYEDERTLLVGEPHRDQVPLAELDSDSVQSSLINKDMDEISESCNSDLPVREIFNIIEEYPDKGTGHLKSCAVHGKLGCPPLSSCSRTGSDVLSTSTPVRRPSSLKINPACSTSNDKTTTSSGYCSMSPVNKSLSEQESELTETQLRNDQIVYLKNRLAVIWQSVMNNNRGGSIDSKTGDLSPLSHLIASASSPNNLDNFKHSQYFTSSSVTKASSFRYMDSSTSSSSEASYRLVTESKTPLTHTDYVNLRESMDKYPSQPKTGNVSRIKNWLNFGNCTSV